MNRTTTIFLIFLILALCTCCLPAGAILQSHSMYGKVIGTSEADHTVTILATHKWVCEYGDNTTTCSYKRVAPRVLTGTVPVAEVFDDIRTDSRVIATSLGNPGGRWSAIGLLTPGSSSGTPVVTDLFGDRSLLPAPFPDGYDVIATTKPDCGNCSGTICTATAADVTIIYSEVVWNGTLLPGEEIEYEDPYGLGSSISVRFISGQAASSLCPDAPGGMPGVQPVSIFIIHAVPGWSGPEEPSSGTGTLRVNSIPSGASILLDGISRGVTPKTLSGLSPGAHTLVLEKEGYVPYEKNLTVTAGRPTLVTAILTPLYGSLRIQSSPSGATVLLNGAPGGVTPLVVSDLSPGEYTVTLAKTGYQTVNRTATVTPGREQLLFVSLSPGENGSEKIDAFIEALQNEGFTVQEGKFENFDVLAMYDAGIIPSCYGNNPSTPYLVYKLPGYPGLARGGRVSDAPINPANKGLWVDYFMEPDEAIVFVGTTPPEAKYYSYRSYVGTRWFSELGTYQRIFASLGDTLNNYRIRTGSSPGQAGSGPYEKPVMIITTADRGTNERVRNAAARAGYSTSMMNDDIIPSGLIKMGLANTSDTIAFLHRLAFFANETRGREYVNGSPGRVLRITPNTSHTPEPYGVPRLIVRGTGDANELDLMGVQETLKEAILARHGSGMVATGNKSTIWILEGYDSLQREADALGDNRDAFYLGNGDYLLSDDEFLILYGVNHKATGKGIYTNIAVYGTGALNGVVAVSDVDLAGSADTYLPGNPSAGLFYVWKFARHCNGEEGCTEIPYCCGGLGIPVDIPVRIGYRTYVEPETGIGPTCTEILYDQAIHFSPG